MAEVEFAGRSHTIDDLVIAGWTGRDVAALEHHIEEEEDELFPQVRSSSDGDALDGLAADLEARKAELGAPTLADKADLSNDRLHELATEQEIPGRSSMNQDELAATVSPS